MNIKWLVTGLEACATTRAEYVISEILRNRNDVTIDIKNVLTQVDMINTDIMVFQRSEDMNTFRYMRMAQDRGIKCIYETDDDMLNHPPGIGKLSEYYDRADVRDSMRVLFRFADACIVSTVPLAQSISQYTNNNIYVVPNFINMEHWIIPCAKRDVERNTRNNIVIMWTTSPMHRVDVPVLNDAMRRVMQDAPNVNLVMFGTCKTDALGDWAKKPDMEKRVMHVEWSDMYKYPMVLSNADIGVAPLVDTAYNRARSNLKWLQFSAIGVPCVLQKLPLYESCAKEGETALFATTSDDWYAALMKLVNDRVLANKIGAQARLDVTLNWDLRTKWKKWMDVFQKIVSEK